jgi:hypothetical protein
MENDGRFPYKDVPGAGTRAPRGSREHFRFFGTHYLRYRPGRGILHGVCVKWVSFFFEPELSGDNYKWTALAVASLGTLIGILNASTLIIALPTMMVKLNTSLIGVTWVLIVYMLILTIFAPACGRLADIYGRKRLW